MGVPPYLALKRSARKYPSLSQTASLTACCCISSSCSYRRRRLSPSIPLSIRPTRFAFRVAVSLVGRSASSLCKCSLFRNSSASWSVENVSFAFAIDLFSRRQTSGIRLRRDIWVSVRYAEALNSATSSVTLQSTDRHGILGQKPTDFQVSV